MTLKRTTPDPSLLLTRIDKQTLRTTRQWIQRDFAPKEARRLQARPYAPQRPGQRYVRTGRFGRAWYATSKPSGGAFIRNRAEQRGRQYAGYVVGDGDGKRQAWMHRGRWPVYRDIVEDDAHKASRELEAELAKKVVK